MDNVNSDFLHLETFTLSRQCMQDKQDFLSRINNILPTADLILNQSDQRLFNEFTAKYQDSLENIRTLIKHHASPRIALVLPMFQCEFDVEFVQDDIKSLISQECGSTLEIIQRDELYEDEFVERVQLFVLNTKLRFPKL